MKLGTDPDTESLAALLEADPGRFEPTTAFRVAQAAGGPLAGGSNVGVSPAPIPVAGFRRVGKPALRTALVGLLGPLGSLPSSYNELALREARNRSGSLSAFVGMFGARLDELFVAACEKYRLARLLRWGTQEGRNAFVKALFSLTGFGTARLRETSGVEDDLVLRFSGFFANRTRNAGNLAAMLGEFSGLPVRIEQFRGRWLPVPPAEQSRLGPGSTVRLGVNAMAGAAIRDFGGAFRVVVGPLDYPDYLSLAPGGRTIAELFALTRLYVGAGLDFDIQVVLRKDEIPSCRLGDAGDPPRLGWNSWARIAPARQDSGDAVITQRHAAMRTPGEEARDAA